MNQAENEAVQSMLVLSGTKCSSEGHAHSSIGWTFSSDDQDNVLDQIFQPTAIVHTREERIEFWNKRHSSLAMERNYADLLHLLSPLTSRPNSTSKVGSAERVQSQTPMRLELDFNSDAQKTILCRKQYETSCNSYFTMGSKTPDLYRMNHDCQDRTWNERTFSNGDYTIQSFLPLDRYFKQKIHHNPTEITCLPSSGCKWTIADQNKDMYRTGFAEDGIDENEMISLNPPVTDRDQSETFNDEHEIEMHTSKTPKIRPRFEQLSQRRSPQIREQLPRQADRRCIVRKERARLMKQLFHRTESTARGYVECKLCKAACWGPNGRYHLDSCSILRLERKRARSRGESLGEVFGIRIRDEGVFSKPITSVARRGKIAGFVIHSRNSEDNPGSETEKRKGTKGYVQCLFCMKEVWAPNSSRHRARCSHPQSASGRNSATSHDMALSSQYNDCGDRTLQCYETLSYDDGVISQVQY